MKIIQCNLRHTDELLQISKQTFYDAFEKPSNPDNFKAYVTKAFTPSVVEAELKNPDSVFYFFKNNAEETIGYVKLRWDRSEEFFPTERALELQRIYLLEKFWNKGYGKTLLNFCEDYGKKHGFLWIWLCVWLENDGAIRFYEREGWEKFGRKDFPFGNEIHNDFVLRKKL
jgi:diamine N-acetyltransferase